MKRLPLHLVYGLLVSAYLAPPAAEAQVTLYPSRAAWDADFPGAAIETFEEADLSANDPESFAPPLDSTTDNTPFDAGDIVAGVSFTTRSSGGTVPGSNLSAGLGTFPSIVLGATSNDCDSLELTLSPAVDGLALDLFVEASAGGPSSVQVELYDGTDTLIDSGPITGGATSQTPVFLGLHSTIPIARVNINNPPGSCGGFEWLDNVAFGAGGPPGVPTMNRAVLFVLAGLLALFAATRLRRAAV